MLGNGNGNIVSSIGETKINEPMGSVDFYIMKTSTPFSLPLKDIGRLGVNFYSLTNEIVYDNENRIIVLQNGDTLSSF